MEAEAAAAGQPASSKQRATGGPAPFLTKTHQMVEEASTDEVISWAEQGRSFVVWKPVELARDLLPLHFKHCNFSSFVRQLNTYVRFPEGGAGPVGVRERQLPARRARPPVGHPSPQVHHAAALQVRRQRRCERRVPAAAAPRVGHHVRRRQRAQFLVGVVAAAGRPHQRERAAQERQPHAGHRAGAGAPAVRGAAGLPLPVSRRPAARPRAAHAGGRPGGGRGRAPAAAAPRGGRPAGARRRGGEEREALRRAPQGRREEEGPVRGGGGKRAAHQDDQGRRAVGRRAVVGPGAVRR
ncbi:heat stress transcription factor B-2a-like isoform X2 [Panicum hallii]|uniref:heat stress transcription factor B-2a-like isoform X2 n=1 Tax=Panicum hallii TaxID=206008 RepID=UPI000DF4D6C0|nr:heat stress transcription factor B-2a-like isoform X2 [Panicum hallii]